MARAVPVKSQLLPVSRRAGAVAVQAAALLLPPLSLGRGTVLHCCQNAHGCRKRLSLKRTVRIAVILEKKNKRKPPFLVKSVGLAAGSEAAICSVCVTVNGETQRFSQLLQLCSFLSGTAASLAHLFPYGCCGKGRDCQAESKM